MKKIVVLVVLTVAASGCGLSMTQKDSVLRYGNAAQTMGQFATNEFVEIRRSIIKMNMDRVTLYGFRDYRDLGGPVDAEALSKRLAATKALKSYGELLVSLTNNSQYGNLKNAALNLSGSLNAIEGIKLDDKQRGTLADLVGKSGSIFLEKRKAKHVREIVRRYQPVIDKICDLLLADFKVQSDGGTGLIAAYQNTAGRLKNKARTVLSSRDRAYSTTDRKRALEAYNLAQETAEQAKQVGLKATKLVTALKTANESIVRTVTDHGVPARGLERLGRYTEELENVYQIFSVH